MKNMCLIFILFFSLSPGYFLYSSALFATKEGAMASFTSPLNEKMTVCLQFQYWYEVNYLRTFFSPAFCKSSSCQNLTFLVKTEYHKRSQKYIHGGLGGQISSIAWIRMSKRSTYWQKNDKISINGAVALAMAFEKNFGLFYFSWCPWYLRSPVVCKNHVCELISVRLWNFKDGGS